MKKTLLPYSEAFKRLRRKFRDLSHDELAMWVSVESLTAYRNKDAAYPNEPPEDIDEYEEEYDITPFSFHGARSVGELRRCFFDPEEISAFTPDTRYLTYQQLVARWQHHEPKITAFIKDRWKEEDKYSLFGISALYRRELIEECMFGLSEVEAREEDWFPASIVQDAEGKADSTGNDRIGVVTNQIPIAPPPSNRTRRDRLTIAILEALPALRKKMKREPIADEVFNYLASNDEIGIIADSDDNKLCWTDTKGKMQNTSRKTLANRLSRLNRTT